MDQKLFQVYSSTTYLCMTATTYNNPPTLPTHEILFDINGLITVGIYKMHVIMVRCCLTENALGKHHVVIIVLLVNVLVN